MPQVPLVIAFGAGVLGFLSPCVVPLIPGYLSFVSGVSLQDPEVAERRRHVAHVVVATTVFVLGFSAIFTALGATASLAGNFVLSNRQLLSRIGGIIVIALGLSVLGVIKLPGFYRERRVHFVHRPGGLLGAFPVGMAFGFAWIPCVGPVLTAILSLAATTERAVDGAVLLFAYSLGLGVPFLIAAVLLTSAFDALSWIKRHGRLIEGVSGTFLVVMGVALVFDMVFQFNGWILRLFPFRPVI